MEQGNSNNSIFQIARLEQEILPKLQSKIDTLNFYLLNGYFYNATPLFDDIGKSGLIEKVKTEYKILFPDHYPFEQTYFNCFLDSNSMSLVKMPNIDGQSEFIKSIDELTKNEPTRAAGFKVFAEISSDGRLTNYEVIPGSDKQIFEKAAHQLKFSSHVQQVSPVVIIVGRSKNKKKFMIVNKRALMVQSSPSFKKQFPFMGAVN